MIAFGGALTATLAVIISMSPVGAQDLPRVRVIATGGTIAGQAAAGQLTGPAVATVGRTGVAVIAFGIRSTAAAVRPGDAECVVAGRSVPARDTNHVLDAASDGDRDLRRPAAAAEIIIAALLITTRPGTAGVD